ncbi:MAG: tyrosine-protein phosphatase, partial [Anderseniella sp.]
IDMSSEERAKNTAAIKAFYLLEPAYIDASRAEAEQRFGGLDAYIKSGLNQSEENLERLRALLLR